MRSFTFFFLLSSYERQFFDTLNRFLISLRCTDLSLFLHFFQIISLNARRKERENVVFDYLRHHCLPILFLICIIYKKKRCYNFRVVKQSGFHLDVSRSVFEECSFFPLFS